VKRSRRRTAGNRGTDRVGWKELRRSVPAVVRETRELGVAQESQDRENSPVVIGRRQQAKFGEDRRHVRSMVLGESKSRWQIALLGGLGP